MQGFKRVLELACEQEENWTILTFSIGFQIKKFSSFKRMRSQGEVAPPPIEMSPMTKMWQKCLLFL